VTAETAPGSFVTGSSITDFQINDIRVCPVHQLMGDALRRKPGPHAGQQRHLPVSVTRVGSPARMSMNPSCLLCLCGRADSPQGASRVKFTPQFLRSMKSPSGRSARFAKRLKKGSGWVEDWDRGGHDSERT
jgi:hypothetical protein